MKISFDKKFRPDLIRTTVEKLTLLLLSQAEPLISKLYWPCLEARSKLQDSHEQARLDALLARSAGGEGM